jgi:hypothetical protein
MPTIVSSNTLRGPEKLERPLPTAPVLVLSRKNRQAGENLKLLSVRVLNFSVEVSELGATQETRKHIARLRGNGIFLGKNVTISWQEQNVLGISLVRRKTRGIRSLTVAVLRKP